MKEERHEEGKHLLMDHREKGDVGPEKEDLPSNALSLSNLSYPPTGEELKKLHPLSREALPKKYHREITQRVFVNRSLRLDKIEWFGFDMDYTLAVYKEPVFEAMTYDIAVARLVKMGYPESIKELKYDPDFPIRGIFIDSELGNLLKVDSFGNVIIALHGRKKIKKRKTFTIYPNGISLRDSGRRFFPINTLFGLPEACLYADLLTYFENTCSSHPSNEDLIHSYDLRISYQNLFQDVRTVIDFIHNRGELKKRVITDLEKFINKDEKLPLLLDTLRKKNRKIFLLTNSQYHYTNHVMTYLLGGSNPNYSSWRDYFDVIIVGAQKPSFFDKGNTLRQVNLSTGALKVTDVTKRFEKGQVYNGGSLEIFNHLAGVERPNQVLYVGDHIFSDIIVSKKVQGWRNLLVIRELNREISLTKANKELTDQVLTFEFVRAEIFRGLDAEATEKPDLTDLLSKAKKASNELDAVYNKYFGSLFRSASKQSFFGMEVQRYADLYAADFANLLNYPLFYTFYAEPKYFSHEDF